MQLMKFAQAGIQDKQGQVLYIKSEDIRSNPNQPRKTFDKQGLMELALSIKQHGLLQPLVVRRTDDCGYELIAGERRLRASAIAGLEKVPCLIIKAGDKESAILALIENIQRRDLDFFEQAEGICRLIDAYGLTQEQAAAKLGKTQSAIANKLRLLKLPVGIRQIILESGLTERHARALLKVHGKEKAVIETIIKRNYNVEQTEKYIESILDENHNPPGKKTYIIKDIRIFINSIYSAYNAMVTSGVDADIQRDESEDRINFVISIPK